MLLLALAASGALPLERPGQTDLTSIVLWDGGVVAFHHLGDGSTSASCEAGEKLGVGIRVGLDHHARLRSRGVGRFLKITDVAEGADGSRHELVPAGWEWRQLVVLTTLKGLSDPCEGGNSREMRGRRNGVDVLPRSDFGISITSIAQPAVGSLFSSLLLCRIAVAVKVRSVRA